MRLSELSAAEREEREELRTLVRQALDKAERIWNKHGIALDEHYRADSVDKHEILPSRIPGHPYVKAGDEKVGTFIALVADMRDSSRHLNCAIAGEVTELERVFYETSALLPALEQVIKIKGGAVTEYLGDGLLAFMEVDVSDRDATIRKAYRVARNCIEVALPIVNEALEARYDLPALEIGIGLALSKAVVSIVGLPGSGYPKVMGRCVYFATKLAGGRNEIIADKTLREAWPRSEGGGIRFTFRKLRDTEGHVIFRERD